MESKQKMRVSSSSSISHTTSESKKCKKGEYTSKCPRLKVGGGDEGEEKNLLLKIYKAKNDVLKAPLRRPHVAHRRRRNGSYILYLGEKRVWYFVKLTALAVSDKGAL